MSCFYNTQGDFICKKKVIETMTNDIKFKDIGYKCLWYNYKSLNNIKIKKNVHIN